MPATVDLRYVAVATAALTLLMMAVGVLVVVEGGQAAGREMVAQWEYTVSSASRSSTCGYLAVLCLMLLNILL
jgi:hypothetical protein